jgi:hypothetical protein
LVGEEGGKEKDGKLDSRHAMMKRERERKREMEIVIIIQWQPTPTLASTYARMSR